LLFQKDCGGSPQEDKKIDWKGRSPSSGTVQETLLVEGKQVPITSGMSLTAEIKVSKRRIIEFFIYPLIKYLDEGIKGR